MKKILNLSDFRFLVAPRKNSVAQVIRARNCLTNVNSKENIELERFQLKVAPG